MSLPEHETRLLICAVLAVAGVVVAIGRFKIHAFPALLCAALLMGLGAGLAPAKVAAGIGFGFGQILGGVGAVIGLGAILGAMVLASGGAERIAAALIGACGPKGAVWLIAAAAMLIGAPLFFESGLIIMLPVIVAVGAQLETAGAGAPGAGYVRAAIPALAGLSVMHGLVAPHPGPLIAINALNAPLGRTFLIGLGMAIPIVIVAGPLFGDFIARFATASPAQAPEIVATEPQGRPAGLLATLATLMTPIALIFAKTTADLTLADTSALRAWADVVGTPTVALLIAVLISMVTLGSNLGLSRDAVAHRVASGLPAMAAILMVIGAGGSFKEILIQSGVGPALADAAAQAHMSPLLVGWLLAVGVRLATGSATVATTTAAGVMAATLHAAGAADRSLLALAIGGGSLFFSHVNDAGFWMVREFLGLSIADTFKTWSTMETIISVMVLGLALLAGAVI